MSLNVWRKHGKMSLSEKKDVPQLVEKYRNRYPEIERDLIRKMIRLENNIENPSELKKLDRYLAKSFKNQAKISNENKPSTEKQVVKTSIFGISEWLNQRAERKSKEQEKIEKARLLESIHAAEELAAMYPVGYGFMKRYAERDRELYKELFGESA